MGKTLELSDEQRAQLVELTKLITTTRGTFEDTFNELRAGLEDRVTAAITEDEEDRYRELIDALWEVQSLLEEAEKVVEEYQPTVA